MSCLVSGTASHGYSRIFRSRVGQKRLPRVGQDAGISNSVRFRAKCLSQREVSPLESGEEVEVVRMPSEDECMNEMFVAIQWGKRTLAIPLAQLEGVEVDDQTKEAIEDWHYWVEQEYEF
jgi:Calcium binding